MTTTTTFISKYSEVSRILGAGGIPTEGQATEAAREYLFCRDLLYPADGSDFGELFARSKVSHGAALRLAADLLQSPIMDPSADSPSFIRTRADFVMAVAVEALSDQGELSNDHLAIIAQGLYSLGNHMLRRAGNPLDTNDQASQDALKLARKIATHLELHDF